MVCIADACTVHMCVGFMVCGLFMIVCMFIHFLKFFAGLFCFCGSRNNAMKSLLSVLPANSSVQVGRQVPLHVGVLLSEPGITSPEWMGRGDVMHAPLAEGDPGDPLQCLPVEGSRVDGLLQHCPHQCWYVV